jgi:enoyl-CoA hydratase
MTYTTIETEVHGRVGLVRLKRPKALNALNATLVGELIDALTAFDADEQLGCIVITGNEKAFAAGADIGAMAGYAFTDIYQQGLFAKEWVQLRQIRKPIVAAVAGYALGGGCELAMACDILIAADTAQFGQPEVKLGIPPGLGGTQRLPRAISKAKAMDMCLTARMMGADEAEKAGLVSRVVAADVLIEEALTVAQTIAQMPGPVVMMIKDAVNRAYESSLTEGLSYERHLFYSAFATADQKEGMQAFIEKRPPQFTHR